MNSAQNVIKTEEVFYFATDLWLPQVCYSTDAIVCYALILNYCVSLLSMSQNIKTVSLKVYQIDRDHGLWNNHFPATFQLIPHVCFQL